MPFVTTIPDYSDKANYLKNLFEEIYIKDIMESNDIRRDESVLNDLLNIISSSVGSLTNPLKLSNTFKTVKKLPIHSQTIERYIGYLEDLFLIEKAKRYSVKGKHYIESPQKYYFTDIGLRNARLNFAEIEENHIMENIIYNSLRSSGYNVDVGVVDVTTHDQGKQIRKQLEIDFVCNKGNEKLYIQSAYALPDKEKLLQETQSLTKTKDSFKKVVVVRDDIVPRQDGTGIYYIGVEQFLLGLV